MYKLDWGAFGSDRGEESEIYHSNNKSYVLQFSKATNSENERKEVSSLIMECERRVEERTLFRSV
jgi:hypothetical protein